MKLTAPYIADDSTEFKAGLNIEIASAHDNYTAKTVDVEVSITGDEVEARRFVGAFPYTDTWTDADVWNFVNTKMQLS